MSFLKFFLRNLDGKNVDHRSNKSNLDISTSAAGIALAGFNCGKASLKAFYSPYPTCKAIYCVSAGLNAASCVSGSLQLLSGSENTLFLPVFFGSLSFYTSCAGRFCTKVADSMDPSSKAIDSRVEKITKGL